MTELRHSASTNLSATNPYHIPGTTLSLGFRFTPSHIDQTDASGCLVAALMRSARVVYQTRIDPLIPPEGLTTTYKTVTFTIWPLGHQQNRYMTASTVMAVCDGIMHFMSESGFAHW